MPCFKLIELQQYIDLLHVQTAHKLTNHVDPSTLFQDNVYGQLPHQFHIRLNSVDITKH